MFTFESEKLREQFADWLLNNGNESFNMEQKTLDRPYVNIEISGEQFVNVSQDQKSG